MRLLLFIALAVARAKCENVSYAAITQIEAAELSKLKTTLPNRSKDYEQYTLDSPISGLQHSEADDVKVFEFYKCYLVTLDSEDMPTSHFDDILGIIALMHKGEKYYSVHGPAIANQKTFDTVVREHHPGAVEGYSESLRTHCAYILLSLTAVAPARRFLSQREIPDKICGFALHPSSEARHKDFFMNMGFKSSHGGLTMTYDFDAEIGRTGDYIVRRLDIRVGKKDHDEMLKVFKSNANWNKTIAGFEFVSEELDNLDLGGPAIAHGIFSKSDGVLLGYHYCYDILRHGNRRFAEQATQIRASEQKKGVARVLMELSYGVEMANRARAAGLPVDGSEGSSGVRAIITKMNVPSLVLALRLGFRVLHNWLSSHRESHVDFQKSKELTDQVLQLLWKREEKGIPWVTEQLQQLGHPGMDYFIVVLDGFVGRKVRV